MGDLSPASSTQHDQVSVNYEVPRSQTTQATRETPFRILPQDTDLRTLPQYYIDTKDCSKGTMLQFNDTAGVINGYVNTKHNVSGHLIECFFKITAPFGYYVNAYSEFVKKDYVDSIGRLTVSSKDLSLGDSEARVGSWICGRMTASHESPLFMSHGNTLFVMAKHELPPADFWIVFKAVPKNLRASFNIVHDSEGGGHITSPGFNLNLNYCDNLYISHTLHVPRSHVLMVSFPYFSVSTHRYFCRRTFLKLFSINTRNEHELVWRKCSTNFVEASVYETPVAIVFNGRVSGAGFKLMFSMHLATESPLQLSSGLFNCSKAYEGFRRHLDCNLRVECQTEEDETERCLFHSPHCYAGSASMGDKCISLHIFEKNVVGTWSKAKRACQARGGDLVMLKTREEQNRLRDILRASLIKECVYIGLRRVAFSADGMYRETWRWIDDTTCYYANLSSYRRAKSTYIALCGYLYSMGSTNILHVDCAKTQTCNMFVCEIQASVKKSTQPVELEDLNSTVNTVALPHPDFIPCPRGHMVHNFLTCDIHSHCGVTTHLQRCVVRHAGTVETSRDATIPAEGRPESTVEMFQCHKFGGTIPYTLLCDFRMDCEDNSDEKHCRHRDNITGFRCVIGQHVPEAKVCDLVKDCIDGSDEEACDNHLHIVNPGSHRQGPPAIINLDGRGNFTEVAMHADDSCPETHFRCPHPVYCMPVFLRCNGVKDCPYGEDELSCEAVVCHGYYRCRGSSVCLHPSHVCDGWPQCPQRDDELLCNASCPSVCQCQGLAFVCHRPFPAVQYPDLRYLDGKGSGIGPSEVSTNVYLIYLSLVMCGVDSWPQINLHNLQSLDLSSNSIAVITLSHFTFLQNLRLLNLKGNVLTTFVKETSDKIQESLLHLDLSHTQMSVFDSRMFVSFASLQTVDLSFSTLTIIGEHGFSFLPSLTQIDLRGCPLEEYPWTLFTGLTRLRSIHTGTYKLCCKETLPENFNEKLCFAPEDETSSCADLLRSNFYRSFLWMISFFSVMGNAGCVLFRLCSQGTSTLKIGYNLFVTNLGLADSLMGTYLVIIGAADKLYRGNYLWNENDWRASVVCTVAGYLSLLSSEVSAFIICLITIDRFIVLRFPFSKFRFKGRSAMLASAIVWLLGLFLAAVPLFPVFSHWRFYGHTGICIPLPVTRNTFKGQSYSFGVMIVFNFILFVLIALGQASIYWTIRANSMEAVSSTNMSRDLTVARRLITVVVSDFLCWFPIGVVGLMAFNGTPIPGEVNVAMAIFVLPLNSALNPFLYTLNMLLEKRRKVRETRLFKSLQERILTVGTID